MRDNRHSRGFIAYWSNILNQRWVGIGKFAQRRVFAIFCIGLLTLIINISILIFQGIPEPGIHDEFSYLLAADTFSKGRLTNPTHPMWEHFESFNIMQRPVYMSGYPPAQGFFLGAGKAIFGHPVFGIWLGNILMSVGFCWMLYGWLPARWAFVGSLIAVFRLIFLTDWSQSYMGASVAAFGGSLIFGAIRRNMDHPRAQYAFIMGLGLAILANSRPLEGLMSSLPVLALIIVQVFRKRDITFQKKILSIILPLVLVMTITFVGIGIYNKMLTGNIYQMPELIVRKAESSVPLFIWQPLCAEPNLKHNVMRQCAEKFSKKYYLEKRGSLIGFCRVVYETIRCYVRSYLGAILWIPLIGFLLWILKSKWMQFAFLAVLIVSNFDIIALSLKIRADYIAPVSSLIFVLLTQSLRFTYILRMHSRRIGKYLVCLALFVVFIITPASRVASNLIERHITANKLNTRSQIIKKLEKEGGKHIIIVRYSLNHNFFHEWVYNEADIDNATVVWAREMDKARNLRLLDYFKGRHQWLLVIDDDLIKPELKPIPSGPGNR